MVACQHKFVHRGTGCDVILRVDAGACSYVCQCFLGAGMICPHWVNYSMMVGAIVSWGIMWPLLRGQAGSASWRIVIFPGCLP